MANPIRPEDLPAKASIATTSAIIFDDGVGVWKGTPAQVLESGFEGATLIDGAAAKSGFDPAGTGAVASTVQAELRKTIRVSQYTTFAQACAAAVAADTALLVDADRTLAANLTTTAKLIPDGGIITTGAFNLTVAAINGPEIPLFDKAGSGTVTISDDTVSWLGWFGPTADGTTDDTNAVKRWAESSAHRRTFWTNICTDTVNVPSRLNDGTSLYGAGPRATIFVSKDGDDVFRFLGVESSSLDYVNWVRCGGFGVVGQGDSTGTGYAVHIPSSVNTGRNNYFEDIDATSMGGGCLKDDSAGGGLFATSWDNCSGGESGGNVFEMQGGGPMSFMVSCYARTAKAGKAGFRVYRSNMELHNCGGLNVNTASGSLWGVFGASTSDVVIDETTYGEITIPAAAFNANAGNVLRGANLEAFPDIAIVAINGTVYLDSNSVFQTEENRADCIAVYCANVLGVGLQGTLPPIGNLVLVGTATWAESCPVWVKGTGAAFQPPVSNGSANYLALRDYQNAITLRLSTIASEYAGFGSNGQFNQFASFMGVKTAMLRVDKHTPASASDSAAEGEVWFDDNYAYFATGSNTIKRVAISTW